MATMSKEMIESAMAAAGCLNPRVIPHKGGDGRLVLNLYAGPVGARRSVSVPKQNNSEDVQEAIRNLNGT